MPFRHALMVAIMFLVVGHCHWVMGQGTLPTRAKQMLERACQIAQFRRWGVKGARQRIPTLLKALDNPDPRVQGAAALALGQLEAEEALDALKRLEREWDAMARTKGFRDMRPLLSIKAAIGRIEAIKSTRDPRQVVRAFLQRFGVSVRELHRRVMEEAKTKVPADGYVWVMRRVADLIATMRERGYDEEALREVEEWLPFHLDYASRLKIELSKIPEKGKRIELLLRRLLTAKAGTEERLCDAQALADEDDDGEVVGVVSEHLLRYHKDREKVKEYWRIDLLLSVLGAIGHPQAKPVVQMFLDDPNKFVRMRAARVFEALEMGKPFPIGGNF